jgi:basic amino acid/polyamine antiporter, APA family
VSASAIPPTPAAAPVTLQRRLGPFDAAAIIVSNVIGGSIFFVPVIVAGLVPSAWLMLSAWLAGGVLAFCGAMAYAELAALRPHAGGEYVYLRDAYGQGAAFLTGWTSFVAGFSGGIAVSAVALAGYIGHFLPAASDTTPLITIPILVTKLVVSKQSLVALSVIAAVSIIHLRRSGRIVHNTLATVTVAALVVFIVLGITLGAGSVGHVTSTHVVQTPMTGWLLALIPIMFTYSGWNAAVYVAEEIRDPAKNLPIALAIGTLAVVVVYLALNVLYLYALPITELAALQPDRLTASVAERLFGFVAGNVLAAFTILSIAAGVSAMVLAGPRIYYAMARDGVFLAHAGRVHSRHRTPNLAIIAQGIWSSVLVLSGTQEQLVAYTGFSLVLFGGVAVLSLFVLRRREHGIARPYHAPGYPVAPALFVAACAVMLVNEIWHHPGTSLAGLGVIFAGWPLYWIFGRKSAAAVQKLRRSTMRTASDDVTG